MNASIGSERSSGPGVAPPQGFAPPPGPARIEPGNDPAAGLRKAAATIPAAFPLLARVLSAAADSADLRHPVRLHEASHAVLTASRGEAVLLASARQRYGWAGYVMGLPVRGGGLRERHRSCALVYLAGQAVDAVLIPASFARQDPAEIPDVRNAEAVIATLNKSDPSASVPALLREAASILSRPEVLAAVVLVADEMRRRPAEALLGYEVHRICRRARRAWRRVRRQAPVEGGETMFENLLRRAVAPPAPTVLHAPTVPLSAFIRQGDTLLRFMAGGVPITPELERKRLIEDLGAAGGNLSLSAIEQSFIRRRLPSLLAGAVVSQLEALDFVRVAEGRVSLSEHGQIEARNMAEDRARLGADTSDRAIKRHAEVELHRAKNAIEREKAVLRARVPGGDLALIPALGVASLAEMNEHFSDRVLVEPGQPHRHLMRCLGCGSEATPAEIIAAGGLAHGAICSREQIIRARREALV